MFVNNMLTVTGSDISYNTEETKVGGRYESVLLYGLYNNTYTTSKQVNKKWRGNMAKFNKKLLLSTAFLIACMMSLSVGCSLFGPIDSSTDSSSQTQSSGISETPGTSGDSSSGDPENGGNWTGEAPLT